MRSFEIPEMTLVIAEDDDIIGEMHVLLINEKKCMFMPDDALKKMLSCEEMEALKRRILEKMELKWADKKIELGS